MGCSLFARHVRRISAGVWRALSSLKRHPRHAAAARRSSRLPRRAGCAGKAAAMGLKISVGCVETPPGRRGMLVNGPESLKNSHLSSPPVQNSRFAPAVVKTSHCMPGSGIAIPTPKTASRKPVRCARMQHANCATLCLASRLLWSTALARPARGQISSLSAGTQASSQKNPVTPAFNTRRLPMNFGTSPKPIQTGS